MGLRLVWRRHHTFDPNVKLYKNYCVCILAGFSRIKLFNLRVTGFPFGKGIKEIEVNVTFVPGIYTLEKAMTSLMIVGNSSLQLPNSDGRPLIMPLSAHFGLYDDSLP